MRFLIDEMFGPAVAEGLSAAGHDAVHVRAIGLGGAPDEDVLTRAVADDRVVITENAADFVPLLDERVAAGRPTTPVLLALKRSLPADPAVMHRVLVERVDAWAAATADPYRHIHWLG